MPFATHFDVSEAKDLIALAANLEGATPPLALPPVPGNWGGTPVFDSPGLGVCQNKWQLWKNSATGQYAVLIRGTIDTTGSIFEDLMAIMIPASGTFPMASLSLPYTLANDKRAAVHLGFFLGMGVLLFDGVSGILAKLSDLPNASQIFITGHSQGAAIATLLRSFLEYSNILAAKHFSYKTYLFAQPKPGNDHYGADFEQIASHSDSGFRIGNSQDWVPQVPLTFQLLRSLNEPNPLDFVTGEVVFKFFAGGVETLREHLTDVHLAKHLPQIIALEEILKAQHVQQTMAVAPATAIEVQPTLNFVNCGSAIALPGTPGQNPTDPKDFFWQHHASMYYDLLAKQFP